MERKLPVITIEGTDFIVDVENMLLRELERKPNSISIFHMKEVEGGYQFIYDKLERNISIWSTASQTHVVVEIPELVKLDPVGMSDKYGVPIGELGTKTDFELMVDQEALKRRLAGELPTIEILGDTFSWTLKMTGFAQFSIPNQTVSILANLKNTMMTRRKCT